MPRAASFARSDGCWSGGPRARPGPPSTSCFLSTLPERTPLRRLAHLAKLRWRIERDFEDLKQEVGLGHYEGRGWRGFHHHATLAIAAYGFLVAERERAAIPPSARRWRPSAPGLPPGFAPRGRPAPA
jgi:SRSO17 transposase